MTFKRGKLPRFARLQVTLLPIIGLGTAIFMLLDHVSGAEAWSVVWSATLARTSWVGAVVSQDRSGWVYRGLLTTRFFGRDEVVAVGLLDAVAWNGIGGFIRLNLRDGTSPLLLMLGQLQASRHLEFVTWLKNELEAWGPSLSWDLAALELNDETD